MPIFDVKLEEITVHSIKVEAPTYEAARSYANTQAPRDIVQFGKKPISESGLYPKSIRRYLGNPEVTVDESGMPIE